MRRNSERLGCYSSMGSDPMEVAFSKPEVIVENSLGAASQKFYSQVNVTINGERIKEYK